MTFDLEEQLARCEVDSSGERQRAYTELETSLQEKEQVRGCYRGCLLGVW